MLGRLPSRRAFRRPPPDRLRPRRRPDGGPAATRLDVVCVGNALVDVLAPATDELTWPSSDLVKGTMALVDHVRAAAIYDRMGATTEASGGSAANTAAGVAALGGRAAFLGRVADDGFGRAFTHDIRSVGVAFDPTPTAAVPGEVVSGHCLVLVTEDAERTMATHLGVASEFGAVDLHDGHLASTQVVYLEGYLWEQAPAKAAMREAIEVGPPQRRRGRPDRVGPVLRRSTTGPSSSSCSTATSSCCSPTRRRP